MRFPLTTSVFKYTLSVNLSSTFFNEMEIVNEMLLVISTPFLLQSKVAGGPPLVSPIRVKVGGSARNEEEERDTWILLITPNTIITKELRLSIESPIGN